MFIGRLSVACSDDFEVNCIDGESDITVRKTGVIDGDFIELTEKIDCSGCHNVLTSLRGEYSSCTGEFLLTSILDEA